MVSESEGDDKDNSGGCITMDQWLHACKENDKIIKAINSCFNELCRNSKQWG